MTKEQNTPETIADDALDGVQGAGKALHGSKGIVLSSEGREPGKGVVLSSETEEPAKGVILSSESEEPTFRKR